MYICTHIRINTYIYAHTYIYIHTCIYICICVCVCIKPRSICTKRQIPTGENSRARRCWERTHDSCKIYIYTYIYTCIHDNTKHLHKTRIFVCCCSRDRTQISCEICAHMYIYTHVGMKIKSMYVYTHVGMKISSIYTHPVNRADFRWWLQSRGTSVPRKITWNLWNMCIHVCTQMYIWKQEAAAQKTDTSGWLQSRGSSSPIKKVGFSWNIYIHAYVYTNVYMTFKRTYTKGGFLRMATVERFIVADKDDRILVKYIHTCIYIYKCIHDIKKDLHKRWIPACGYSREARRRWKWARKACDGIFLDVEHLKPTVMVMTHIRMSCVIWMRCIMLYT